MSPALRRRLGEHALVILVIGSLFFIAARLLTTDVPPPDPPALLRPFFDQKALHLDDPLHFTMIADALDLGDAAADSLRRAYASWKESLVILSLEQRNRRPLFEWGYLGQLAGMGFQFTFYYVIVLLISYAGARFIGTYQFCRAQHNDESPAGRMLTEIRRWRTVLDGKQQMSSAARVAGYAGMTVLTAAVLLTAFSPAYVPAYALKSYISTDSSLLMILLAVGTNGLMMSYAQKYRALLIQESKKGYVETAVVKGLSTNYRMPLRNVLFSRFDGHVLKHIAANADFAYGPTFKEQASFVITGLVIIEMALNMQGRLCYEMLQQMLYRNYSIVFAIMMGLFLLVKGTEIAVDVWMLHWEKKYDNA